MSYFAETGIKNVTSGNRLTVNADGSILVEIFDGSNILGTFANPVRIDTTGTTTQPISGTVTANAGTGTFTVGQATGTNLHTVVDSGTIIANIGTSGSLALDASVTGLQISQGSTTSGQKGNLILGAVTTSSPSYTTAQSNPLSLDTNGALRVNITTNTTSTPSAFNISEYVTANKVFVTAFNVNQPTSGSDNPLLYLRNPTGSGKTLYIYKIGLGINVANVFSNFKLYVDPTVTANGTSQSATSLNIGGGSPASSMLATSTPTTTSSGTIIESWQGGQNTNSISFIEDLSIHIAANHSLLITGSPSSNNREAAITLVWVEV